MSRFIDFESFRNTTLRAQVTPDGTARFGVELSTDTRVETVNVDLALAGPGQLASLNRSAIKSTKPANNLGNFRAGELAFIEFHDPTLPWALSFNTAPTLGLICIEDTPAAQLNTAKIPNATLRVTAATALPAPSLFTLMAHIQAGQTAQTAAFSRILCPQELLANTRYIAALVPLTAAGVRAGLGLAPLDQLVGDGGPAWDAGHGDLVLPALTWWRFGTGTGRGAEDMLRDLRARDIDASPQTLALTDESARLLGLTNGAQVEAVTVLAEEPSQVSESAALIDPLTPQTAAGEPRLPLPSYANTFANASDAGNGLTANDPNWFRMLNRTPGYRIMAGRGTALVRRHQEEIVGFIRSDAGQIEDANALLSRAHLGMQTGKAIHTALSQLSPEALVRFAGPAHRRTKIGGQSVARQLSATAHQIASQPVFRRRIGPGATPKAAGRGAPKTSLTGDIATVFNRARTGDDIAGTGLLGDWDSRKPTSRGTYLDPDVLKNPIETLNSLQENGPLARAPDSQRDTMRDAARTAERERAFRPAGPRAIRATLPRQFAQDLHIALNPANSVPPRLRARIGGSDAMTQTPPPRRLLHDPVWPEPILERLFDLDPDALAPGLSGLPADSVTGLILDGAALEAVVAGANHEVLRELAWRGHPVAIAPSPVRRAFPSLQGDNHDFDLAPMTQWDRAAPLGHGWAGRVGFMAIVRSDIFRQSADVIAYLCPASWRNGTREINPNTDLRYPVAIGQIGLDMIYLGFQENAETMRGKPDGSGDAGMFLTFEIPSEGISFGLGGRNGAAARDGANIATTGGWQSLDWDDMPGPALDRSDLETTEINNLKWARSSADMAGILMERPLVMAIHASELLGPTS